MWEVGVGGRGRRGCPDTMEARMVRQWRRRCPGNGRRSSDDKENAGSCQLDEKVKFVSFGFFFVLGLTLRLCVLTDLDKKLAISFCRRVDLSTLVGEHSLVNLWFRHCCGRESGVVGTWCAGFFATLSPNRFRSLQFLSPF